MTRMTASFSRIAIMRMLFPLLLLSTLISSFLFSSPNDNNKWKQTLSFGLFQNHRNSHHYHHNMNNNNNIASIQQSKGSMIGIAFGIGIGIGTGTSIGMGIFICQVYNHWSIIVFIRNNLYAKTSK
mmetsp:Transcript_11874/g.16878  ORF Transcript_11874/g.16878 Transcript_11874/m.16878 type:complete len:126 (-) Transcript_11874:160-537(-)